MKAFCKIVLIAMGLFLISTSAVATGYRHHGGLSFSFGSHGNHIRYNYNNHHFDKYAGKHYRHHYSPRPYTFYKYRAQPRHGHKPFSYYSFSHRHPSYHQNRYQKDIVKKSCHPVTKVIVGRHGRYHGRAGTMCYDKFGDAYIVYNR